MKGYVELSQENGTATAIRIAMKYDIPVFNLGIKDKESVLQSIKKFLEDGGVV